MNPSDKDAISADEQCGFPQRGISSPSEQKSDEGLANQNTRSHGCDTPCDMIEKGACKQFHGTTENQNTKFHGCDTLCDTIEEGVCKQFHDTTENQNTKSHGCDTPCDMIEEEVRQQFHDTTENQNTKSHGCDTLCDTIEEGVCKQFHDTTENQNTKSHGCDTPCDMIEEEVRQQFHDTTEVQNGFWLSEKLYFHFIMTKAHLKSLYRLVLPAKVHLVLPEKVVPMVLTCRNKNWEMNYLGDCSLKRFDNGWKTFVVDNDIKSGDGVVLELLECSEALIKFRVQILSGDIPPELLHKVDGCANPNLQSTGCGAPSSQAEVGGAQQQLKHGNTEMQDDLFWLTDGTPYFKLILAKSHLTYPYVLVMPAKMQQILPEKEVPVILACGNKSWKMTYLGDNRSRKRLDSKWRQFIVDNNLKIGDGCIFELLECTEALIKFRVKVLSGDFPAELLDRIDGHCSKNPIVLD